MLKITLTVCYFFVTCLQIVFGQKNCDTLGILLYEDIGCKPVKPEGSDCPIKYECEEFSEQSDGCTLRGRSFNENEHVDSNITYPSCEVGCFCHERSFTCAILDCPEWLGAPLGEGCHRKYEVDKCCSVGEICPTTGSSYTCTVDGETYQEGQKFTPKNVCSTCVCPKNFNGKIEEPHCRRRSCNVQLRNSDKLEKKCAPFYYKSFEESDEILCCPYQWICPSENDKIIKVNKEVKENPDLTCKFGSKTVKLGEGFEKEFDFHGSSKKAKCECILPPYLTCKEVVA